MGPFLAPVEGGLLNRVELNEVQSWLASDIAVKLGYTEQLLQLAEQSRLALEQRAGEDAPDQGASAMAVLGVAALLLILLAAWLIWPQVCCAPAHGQRAGADCRRTGKVEYRCT